MKVGLALALLSASAWSQALAGNPPGPYESTGQFAGSYLCIGEASGGVIYDSNLKRWHPYSFNLSSLKRVVNVTADRVKDAKLNVQTYPAMQYAITVRSYFGGPTDNCASQVQNQSFDLGTQPILSKGFAFCDTLGEQYTFNFISGRYETMHSGGYTDGQDSQFGSAYVEIGECSRIN